MNVVNKPRPRPTPPRAQTPLVTASCLADTPDGAQFPLPGGARITPHAQDEAWRRRIRFVSPGSPSILRVAVGSDHGGFALKGLVIDELRELGLAALDLGTHDTNACDYPDYARAVGEAVAGGRADLGVLVDGAGIGSAMAAGKVPGVLAANCWDERTARNAREHNHANVLCLGTGGLDDAGAVRVLRAFLSTAVGTGRHARRVAKIKDLEGRYAR